MRIVGPVFGCVIFSVLATTLAAESRIPGQHFTFTGQANGGTLVLAQAVNRNPRFVEVRTQPGESAESVAQKLAAAIGERDPFRWRRPGVRTPGAIGVSGTDGTLGPLPALTPYVLAGTETGLGIPAPPLFVSGRYDPDSDQVDLHWENPEGGYESIKVVIESRGEFHGSMTCPGTRTSFTFPRGSRSIDGMDVRVIGYKNGLPSNAGAITINRGSQEELIGTPFARGLAPNWDLWALGDGRVKLRCEPADSDANGSVIRPYRNADSPQPTYKPFRQLIRVDPKVGAGGVYRKFLGLKPGATYRVTAQVGSHAEGGPADHWEASFWASPVFRGGNLTPQHFAGRAALPGKAMEDETGRLAVFAANEDWMAVSTAPAPVSLVEASAVIKLPADCDSLTAWARCQGDVPVVFVVEWIRLEEVSTE